MMRRSIFLHLVFIAMITFFIGGEAFAFSKSANELKNLRGTDEMYFYTESGSKVMVLNGKLSKAESEYELSKLSRNVKYIVMGYNLNTARNFYDRIRRIPGVRLSSKVVKSGKINGRNISETIFGIEIVEDLSKASMERSRVYSPGYYNNNNKREESKSEMYNRELSKIYNRYEKDFITNTAKIPLREANRSWEKFLRDICKDLFDW